MGGFWHMNPKIYLPENVNKKTKKTAQEVWDSDKEKIDFATSKGFQVLVIWESDYERCPKEILQKSVDFLYPS